MINLYKCPVVAVALEMKCASITKKVIDCLDLLKEKTV